jgi:hypothetical protein
MEQEALTRLHIFGLPDKITEDEHLSMLFSSFGRVCSVALAGALHGKA